MRCVHLWSMVLVAVLSSSSISLAKEEEDVALAAAVQGKAVIRVSGVAVAERPPAPPMDQVLVKFDLVSGTSGDPRASIAELEASTYAALEALGIARERIETAEHQPTFARVSNQLVARLKRTWTLRLEDRSRTEDLAVALSRIAEPQSAAATIEKIEFTDASSEPRPEPKIDRAELERRALQDAREKAAQRAQALGKAIGDPLYVRDAGGAGLYHAAFIVYFELGPPPLASK